MTDPRTERVARVLVRLPEPDPRDEETDVDIERLWGEVAIAMNMLDHYLPLGLDGSLWLEWEEAPDA
jgi:hypothetical protein